jgi:DNA-3-methyladenine glycosylase
MYHCLNFTTEQEGFPAAVLIRGVEPVEGVEEMKRRRDHRSLSGLANGPGKICQAFGIDKTFYGLELTGTRIWVEDRGEKRPAITQSTRIGIAAGKEKPWRFYVPKSSGVSKDGKKK